jgi:preprotein translocase subunit SecG
MVSILLALNAFICVALIILILLQRSDPASGGMFGGAGGGGQPVLRNPLARPTAILAALFLVFSVAAAVLNKGGSHGGSVMAEGAHAPVVPAPASLPDAALLPLAVSATAAVSPATVPASVTPTQVK